MKIIIYRRLSKQKTTDNQYGFDSQQADIDHFLKTLPSYEIVSNYAEFFSGKGSWEDRKELVKAVNLCKETGATLLVSKIDRLGRNVASVAKLLETIPVRIATMPSATNMVVQIMSAVAEEEARAISDRVKKALAVAKSNGKKLGGAATRRRISQEKSYTKIVERDSEYKEYLSNWRSKGLTLQQCADRMNEMGIKSPRGSDMTSKTVQRMCIRLGVE